MCWIPNVCKTVCQALQSIDSDNRIWSSGPPLNTIQYLAFYMWYLTQSSQQPIKWMLFFFFHFKDEKNETWED